MNLRLKRNKYMIIFMCILISFCIEIALFNNSRYRNRVSELSQKDRVINSSEIELWNYEVQQDKYITQIDPNIMIFNLNTYVGSIDISMTTSKRDIPIQVFFTNNENINFSEEMSIKKGILYFDENTEINLNQQVKDLRIDLGDQPGLEIENLKVIINPTTVNFNILRILVVAIVCYYIFCLISRVGMINKKIFALFTIIAGIRVIFYLSLTPYFLTPDSYDYIGINSKTFLDLNFDPIRVPVYPVIIDIVKYIFGNEYYLNMVVLLQIVVSYISVIVFYKTLKMIINRERIIYLITILYACTPAIIGWDKTILTESLSISGVVFWGYYLISYLKAPKLANGIYVAVISLILTLLRPTCLILVVICFVFWIVRWIVVVEERSLILRCLASITISGLVLIGYGVNFYHQFGIFNLSNTIIRQNVYTIVQEGYYRNCGNKELAMRIEKNIADNNGEFSSAIGLVYEEYTTNKDVMSFINESITNSKKEYIMNNIVTSIKLADVKFPSNCWYSSNINDDTLYREDRGNAYYRMKHEVAYGIEGIIRGISPNITFMHVYFVIVLEAIISIYLMVKKKVFPWIHIGIFSVVAMTTLGAIVGTYAEWARTAICVLPYVYMAIGMYLQMVFYRKE